jgi:hypothetical protein
MGTLHCTRVSIQCHHGCIIDLPEAFPRGDAECVQEVSGSDTLASAEVAIWGSQHHVVLLVVADSRASIACALNRGGDLKTMCYGVFCWWTF